MTTRMITATFGLCYLTNIFKSQKCEKQRTEQESNEEVGTSLQSMAHLIQTMTVEITFSSASAESYHA